MNADRGPMDPALAALLRDHSAESPPADVDAAILAAAHRAVGSAPRARDRALARQAWRWWMPLAAAAVIGVVVIGLLPLAPTVVDDTSRIASDAPDAARSEAVFEDRRGAAPEKDASPGPATNAPPETKTAPAMNVPPATNAPRPEPPGERAKVARPAPAAPAAPFVAPPLQTAPSPTDAPAPARSFAMEPSQAPRTAPVPRTTPAPRAERERQAPAPDPMADRMPNADAAAGRSQSSVGGLRKTERSTAERLTSDNWIARIAALRSQGKQAEALRELARFREAYTDADARLPADLREWAARQR